MEPGFFPLDEELGLLPGSLSPTLQEGVVRLGAALPFGQVVDLLHVLAKVRVSRSTVQRVTEAAGAALVAVEDAALVELERTWPAVEPGAAQQQVSIDGAMVSTCRKEWKEVRTLVIGALSAAQPGQAEALSYRSRLEDAEAFTRTATSELHRRGTFLAEQVVGVVDGAGWCQTFFDYHLPGAVRVLDFPHAVQHLSQAAQAVLGTGTAACREWLAIQTHTLRHGDPGAVLAAVTALPVEIAIDPADAAKTRDRVATYLATRREQLAYAAFVAQGFPIGSGVVESANKILVEARLKGGGMHWLPAHVNALLALRCAIFNDRWDEAWTASSHQRRTAARRSVPRPRSPAPAPITGPLAPRPRPDPPPAPLRGKTIVNGKPTADHPWKRRYLPPSAPASIPITKL